MRSKKALLNVTISILYQIVALVCGLITPRLILLAFGSTYNGVVSSAVQFLNLVSILRLGIAGATRVELYKTLAADDNLGTSRIIKATKQYMRKISLVIVFYALALSFLYPLISKNSLPWYECTFIILIVSVGTFVEYFFGITYSTLISADQREYVQAAIHIVTTVLNTVAVVILIRLGADVFTVKLVSSVVFALLPISLSIYCRKKYRLTNKCEADRTALRQRGAVAFHSVANIVHDHTDLVLLTLFMDAKIISVYTVYYLAVGKIKAIMSSFTSGLEAAFGNMWAKKEYEAVSKNFRIYEFAIFSFVAVVFPCVELLLVPFVRQYTRGVTDTNYILPTFALLISVTEAVYFIRNPYLTLVQATGRYKETKNGAALEAAMNIAVSLVLINIIGLNGVIIGTLVANTIRSLQFVHYVSKHILCRSIMHFIKRFIWLVCTSLLTVFAFRPIGNMLSGFDGWSGWIINAVACFVFASVVALIMAVLFYRGDFISMLSLMKRMISRRASAKKRGRA